MNDLVCEDLGKFSPGALNKKQLFQKKTVGQDSLGSLPLRNFLT